jgi:hypothetical protein
LAPAFFLPARDLKQNNFMPRPYACAGAFDARTDTDHHCKIVVAPNPVT